MSDLRIEVQPYGDGRVLLTLGDLSLTLAPDARDKLRELLDRAAMPGQPAPCAYCEDEPDHPYPDAPGSCTCAAPGCGRGWCPQRDDYAAMPGQRGGGGEPGAAVSDARMAALNEVDRLQAALERAERAAAGWAAREAAIAGSWDHKARGEAMALRDCTRQLREALDGEPGAAP